MTQIRIGMGYDVHPFAEGRKLILGAIEIPHEKGLLGHSDADALLHAIADALLGSLALGDLGTYFPDHDPKWKGVSSLVILKETYKMVLQRGYQVGNIDAIIIAQAPKLKPYIESMRKNIAEFLNIAMDSISVKATSTNGLGFIGNKEGIAAQAVVLVQQRGMS